MAHGLSVDIPHEFGNVLGDAQDGWNDGVLTADEMSDDPEAAALLLAPLTGTRTYSGTRAVVR